MTDRWGAIVGLLVIAFVVWKIWSEFSRANRGSAENALFTEIVMQLKNWPPDTPYPGSLSELRLTYPDGGSPSILASFEYNSSGTSCVLRIKGVTPDHEITFP